jgi:hypothetical protein
VGPSSYILYLSGGRDNGSGGRRLGAGDTRVARHCAADGRGSPGGSVAAHGGGVGGGGQAGRTPGAAAGAALESTAPPGKGGPGHGQPSFQAWNYGDVGRWAEPLSTYGALKCLRRESTIPYLTIDKSRLIDNHSDPYLLNTHPGILVKIGKAKENK